jgi:hypothetical protein
VNEKQKRISEILDKLAAYHRQGLIDVAAAMTLVQEEDGQICLSTKETMPIGSVPSLSVFTDEEVDAEANRRLLGKLDAESIRFERKEYYRLRAKYEHE